MTMSVMNDSRLERKAARATAITTLNTVRRSFIHQDKHIDERTLEIFQDFVQLVNKDALDIEHNLSYNLIGADPKGYQMATTHLFKIFKNSFSDETKILNPVLNKICNREFLEENELTIVINLLEKFIRCL